MTTMKTLAKKLPTMKDQTSYSKIAHLIQLKMASWILLLMGSKSQTAYQEHRPDQSFDIRTRSILMFCFSIRHPGIKTEMADV